MGSCLIKKSSSSKEITIANNNIFLFNNNNLREMNSLEGRKPNAKASPQPNDYLDYYLSFENKQIVNIDGVQKKEQLTFVNERLKQATTHQVLMESQSQNNISAQMQLIQSGFISAQNSEQFNVQFIEGIEQDEILQRRFRSKNLSQLWGQGQVLEVFDQQTQEIFLLKAFAETIEEATNFLYEKNIGLLLKMMLKDEAKSSYPPLSGFFQQVISYNDKKLQIVWQLGHCSLQNLMNYKRFQQQMWSEKDITYIFWRLLLFCETLFQAEIYHSNWMPENVGVEVKNQQEVQIRLLNFAGASVDFRTVHQYNKFFAPPHFKHLQIGSKQQRLAVELFQIGRIAQILIYHSQYRRELITFSNSLHTQYQQQDQFVPQLNKSYIDMFVKIIGKTKINTLVIKALQLCLLDNKTQNDYVDLPDLLQELLNEFALHYKLAEINDMIGRGGSKVGVGLDPAHSVEPIMPSLNMRENLGQIQEIKRQRLHTFPRASITTTDAGHIVGQGGKRDSSSGIERFEAQRKTVQLYDEMLLAHIQQHIINEKFYQELLNKKIQIVIDAFFFVNELKHTKLKIDWAQQIRVLDQTKCMNKEQQGYLLNYYGFIYKYMGKLQEAAQFFQRALELQRQSFGERDPALAANLNNLGTVYYEQGKLGEAEEQFRRALELQTNNDKSELNKSHLAAIISNLGRICQKLDRPEEAESQYRKAIEIEKRLHGEGNPRLANRFTQLGQVYLKQGKLQLSIDMFQTAIELQKKVLGKDNPKMAKYYCNMGKTLLECGRFSEAEALFRQTLELQLSKKVMGGGQSSSGGDGGGCGCGPINCEETCLADVHNNLGKALQELGNLKEAEKQFAQAIQLYSKAQQEDPKRMIACFCNQVTIMSEMGNFKEAEFHLNQALNEQKLAFGGENHDYASVLVMIGKACQEVGWLSDAERYFLRSVHMQKTRYGESYLGLAPNLNNLGLVYQMQGKYKPAEVQFIRAINLEKMANNGKSYPRLANYLNNLGRALQMQGKLHEAEVQIRQAIALQVGCFGKEYYGLALTYNNLGSVLQELGKLKEAEEYFLKTLEIEKRSLGGERNPEIANTLNNLGAVYQEQDRLPEAEDHFRRALAIQNAILGPNHPEQASALSNLGIILQRTYRFIEAEANFKQALEVQLEAYGLNYPGLATYHANLGALYQELGMVEQAKEQLDRVAYLEKVALGFENQQTWTNTAHNSESSDFLKRHFSTTSEQRHQELPIEQKPQPIKIQSLSQNKYLLQDNPTQ